MYRNILAAVNEFSNSEIAARYALILAKACNAKIFLVFVSDEKIEKIRLRHAESALERLFIEAGDNGIEAESIILSGDPFTKIKELVKKEAIDIVFAATRREDVQKRFFLKTFSRQLFLQLTCSVAMVRVVRMGGIHLKNILVPMRGRISSLEERAFFVSKLAKGTGAKVMLFHSHRPVTGFFRGEIHFKPLHRSIHIPHDMERFFEYLGRDMITTKIKVEYGDVTGAIMLEAAFAKNDLIIMGASEKNFLGSMLTGTSVERLLRQTPCNMIVFRQTRGK